jgi:hypothetical protein
MMTNLVGRENRLSGELLSFATIATFVIAVTGDFTMPPKTAHHQVERQKMLCVCHGSDRLVPPVQVCQVEKTFASVIGQHPMIDKKVCDLIALFRCEIQPKEHPTTEIRQWRNLGS